MKKLAGFIFLATMLVGGASFAQDQNGQNQPVAPQQTTPVASAPSELAPNSAPHSQGHQGQPVHHHHHKQGHHHKHKHHRHHKHKHHGFHKGHHKHYKHCHKAFFKKLHALNLSADQKAQIKDIHHKFHDAMKADRENMMKEHEAHAGIRNLSPGSADYDSKTNEAAQAVADRFKNHLLAMAKVKKDVYNVLNADQKAQVDKDPKVLNFLAFPHMMNHHGHFRGHFHHGFKHHGKACHKHHHRHHHKHHSEPKH